MDIVVKRSMSSRPLTLEIKKQACLNINSEIRNTIAPFVRVARSNKYSQLDLGTVYDAKSAASWLRWVVLLGQFVLSPSVIYSNSTVHRTLTNSTSPKMVHLTVDWASCSQASWIIHALVRLADVLAIELHVDLGTCWYDLLFYPIEGIARIAVEHRDTWTAECEM
jgi:hypothetical protein